jgi:O-methyltransferase involved in polyketide biosynthesis
VRAGHASDTAMLVAASVAMRGGAHGLPAIAIELAESALVLGAALGSFVARLSRHRPGRLLLRAMERIVLPGLAAHHCARKAWLWQRLQRPETAGRQLVWLGVGFDGLGRALLANGGTGRVVETDHPDTLRQRRALVCDGVSAMHPIELPRQLAALAALCAAGPTTIVCEGMLMYLPPGVVVRALRTLAALPRPPHLLFTALDTIVPGGRGFRRPATLVHRWLQHHGEPFRWRARPERIARCLAAAGYVVAGHWDGDGFGEYAIAAVPGR